MRYESFLNRSLSELRAAQLFRDPDDGAGRLAVEQAAAALKLTPMDASSNDYLGLMSLPVSRETSGNAGAGASRLIYGTSPDHLELEAELASWVGAPAALLFSSTFAANLGVIAALGGNDSLIISDAFNHASLIDGARLAKAETRVVPHLDLDAIRVALNQGRQAKACFVVTESYFSMDGDGPDLAALRDVCDAHDACLIVDEAHALGVFGPEGAGRCAEAGIQAEVLVGALGKAVGTQGGFVAGCDSLRAFMWNKARSFVFSTAPSPRLAQLTRQHVALVRRADQLRVRLANNCRQIRARLSEARLPVAAGSFGPIISLVLQDNDRVLVVAARLRAQGILAQAIRPPTVPVGSARLRLTIKASFDEADLERLARAVEKACDA